MAGLLGFDDGVPPFGIVGAFQQVGDMALQPGDEIVHGLDEQPSLAGREPEQPGLVGVLEIIDIEQVFGRRVVLFQAFEECLIEVVRPVPTMPVMKML